MKEKHAHTALHQLGNFTLANLEREFDFTL